jgi:hypothetical protein
MKIAIGVDESVPEAMLPTDRFLDLYRYWEKFYADPKSFTQDYRDGLCAHESGHTIYFRQTGVRVEFRGPTVWYLPEKDILAMAEATVMHDIPDCEAVQGVKCYRAGALFRRALTGKCEEEFAEQDDIDRARRWFLQKFPDSTEEHFQKILQTAESEILQDLESPAFVELAWKTAKEIEDAIFPKPEWPEGLRVFL